jgi:hypothetical protein
MTLKMQMALGGFALTLAAPASAVAQVTPLLPPPFIGAPMNDDPRAGQFALTFDDRGLVEIGRAAVGTNPSNYPVFTFPGPTAADGAARRSASGPGPKSGNSRVGDLRTAESSGSPQETGDRLP